MQLKDDDIVLCTVKHIEGTTVFVKIDAHPEESASMVLSEVAAGRIRNLRDYVAPNKKIVCKILKTTGNHIELSLRRVTAREREEVLAQHKQERALLNMLKTVVKNPEKTLISIKETHDIIEFIEDARENPKVLEKHMSKEEATKLCVIIKEKESGAKTVTAHFTLTTDTPQGLSEIQNILTSNEDIRYLGSSRFTLNVSRHDFKEANTALAHELEEIEKRAKKKKAHFTQTKH